MIRRLAGLPPASGAEEVAPLVAPVDNAEERETGLPAGAAIPPALRKVVEPALSAPVEVLVDRGVAPSAEVLAELVPQLVASAGQEPARQTLRRVAELAAELLDGSLDARYYGIDCGTLRELAAGARESSASGKASREAFAQLCIHRAGAGGDTWSVAANGMVIEQAQILTTHNLATPVSRVGIEPRQGWEELARSCSARTCLIIRRLPGHPRPSRAVKDAAYAWRQLLFFLSRCETSARERTLSWLDEETDRHPAAVGRRLAPAVAGLRFVGGGGACGPVGAGGAGARRSQGWSVPGRRPARDPALEEPS
ncbi:hypothetical protein [Streptomyces sp. N35]|uniref:hypothetical protein n=1 Tax=Streptomyces sp. N35 TaxID=2795730 RepID=UPI001F1B23FA|nr:hypothetical protein [Streptomyces sp. N35]